MPLGLLAAVLAMLVGAGVGTPEAATPALPGAEQVFEAPVQGPIADGYRSPPHPYGPGNRGWEYATEPQSLVRASGRGVVTFAGQVGGELHVTVAHGAGLVTTVSFLDDVTVTRGEGIERGDPLGTSGQRLHFGVRLAGEYLDPGVLLTPGALVNRAVLLPARPAR